MGRIDELGGSVAAIEAGFLQREIHQSALAWQRDVEAGRRPVIGVNMLEIEEDPPTIFRPDDGDRERVLADLAALRAGRDGAAVEGALRALEENARGTGSLMEPIVAAVAARATIGEVCETLEDVFGHYRPPEVL
jgi:methylmalonyl-CoA mutase N-terminal domain/subunit